uniref:Solute carrier family 2, facilitated glucose transporter member 5 n=1 Tax=Gadus morhua TaxID=8049 RepID=A0A8C5AWI4_GADMO
MSLSVSQLQYRRLYLLSLVLGIGGSFQYGIQVSMMASAAEHVQSFVNDTWMERYAAPVDASTSMLIWSFVVSVFSLGAWAGAVHSGSLPVTYGRKKALLFNNVVAVVAALLMVFCRMARSFEMILLARFLYGYNVGLGLSVHLMYLGECAPKKRRGFLTLTGSIFIAAGKVTGQIIGLRELLGSDSAWPYLLASSGVPAVVQFVSLLFFPESPRYLYIDKGDTEASKTALHWLWQEDDLKQEEDDMRSERESVQGEKAKTVLDVLRSRCVRWQLLALAIPCAGVQFCGNNALYFYAFDIFREAGVAEDKMHYLSIGIGATEFVTISLCVSTARSYTGYSFEMTTDLYPWIPYVNISLIFTVICIYGLGPSGVSMALPADLFLQAWRPSAYVCSGTINWVGMFLIGMLFPYIVGAIGQFCFLIFVAYCIFSSAFMLYFVPETKGKSMIEIAEAFNKLNYKHKHTEKEPNMLQTQF